MAKFGIIGEGITDQIILESILIGFFAGEAEDDEPEVAYVQPPLDTSGQSGIRPPGGWTLIFDYLRRQEYRKALQFFDYLVIHVDTDVSEDHGFDVPKQNKDGPLTTEQLVAAVIARLVNLIGKETYDAHASRFLFAVAVHSTECWLLPLFFDDNKAAKETGCLKTIDFELRQKKKEPLSVRDGEEKNPRSYKKVSKDYERPKILRKSYPKNPSFALFVEQLAAIRPPATAP